MWASYTTLVIHLVIQSGFSSTQFVATYGRLLDFLHPNTKDFLIKPLTSSTISSVFSAINLQPSRLTVLETRRLLPFLLQSDAPHQLFPAFCDTYSKKSVHNWSRIMKPFIVTRLNVTTEDLKCRNVTSRFCSMNRSWKCDFRHFLLICSLRFPFNLHV